jgi:hypothetical protein
LRAWPVKGTCPGTEAGSPCDQDRRNDEKRALPQSRRGAVPDEAPYDVVAIDEVSEKGGSDDERMNQRLVAISRLVAIIDEYLVPRTC